MGEERYVYQTLEPGSIRLLTPDQSTDGRINFSISHTELGYNHSPYATLSYRWGTEIASEHILIDGKTIQVTENLLNALRDLRYHMSHDLRLWVDAVYINQKDTIERNHQVQVMKDIFSTADITYSYLGPNPEHRHDEQLLHTLYDCYRWRRFFNRDEPQSFLPNHHGHRPFPITDDTVVDIAQSLYWTRMWILPEFLVSRRIPLYSGRRGTTWQQLSEGLTKTALKTGNSLGVAQQLCYERKARAIGKSPPNCNLFALL